VQTPNHLLCYTSQKRDEIVNFDQDPVFLSLVKALEKKSPPENKETIFVTRLEIFGFEAG
jgi:hypothetical protein